LVQRDNCYISHTYASRKPTWFFKNLSKIHPVDEAKNIRAIDQTQLTIWVINIKSKKGKAVPYHRLPHIIIITRLRQWLNFVKKLLKNVEHPSKSFAFFLFPFIYFLYTTLVKHTASCTLCVVSKTMYLLTQWRHKNETLNFEGDN